MLRTSKRDAGARVATARSWASTGASERSEGSEESDYESWMRRVTSSVMLGRQRASGSRDGVGGEGDGGGRGIVSVSH